jgi:hypothetical protein
MNEAGILAKLDNENIIHVIGVCKADIMMLVLELAPLGQLNKYLQKSPYVSLYSYF